MIKFFITTNIQKIIAKISEQTVQLWPEQTFLAYFLCTCVSRVLVQNTQMMNFRFKKLISGKLHNCNK